MTGTITLGGTLYINISMIITRLGANLLAVDGNNATNLFAPLPFHAAC